MGLTAQEKRERRKERRQARKALMKPQMPQRRAEATPETKSRPGAKQIIEKFFRYEVSHGQPKIFCKACGKSFSWNDLGRSLGISVSFAARHITEKHGAPGIYPDELKDWIKKR